MNTQNFFNEIETKQQLQLAIFMGKHKQETPLLPNQRIKEDKRTHIKWLEEKMLVQTLAGRRWSWVRVAVID